MGLWVGQSTSWSNNFTLGRSLAALMLPTAPLPMAYAFDALPPSAPAAVDARPAIAAMAWPTEVLATDWPTEEPATAPAP